MDMFLFGYLDPGSGSMLMQLLVGGIAGLGVFCKLYGRVLIGALSRRFGAVQPPQEA